MQPSTRPLDFSFHLNLASAPCQRLLLHRVSRLRNKSSIVNRLRTLILSCRSFCNSRPFFSIACGLFVQNTGGMGTSSGSSRTFIPHSPIDFLILYFHGLPKPFSCNPFPFTSIQNPPAVFGCAFFPSSKKAAALFDIATYECFAIQAILGRHRATIGSRSARTSPLPRAAHSYAPRRHTSQWTHFQASCYQSVWKRHGGP